MSMDALTNKILARVTANKRVRLELPDGGRLHIDRQLPFLCLYRQPVDRDDIGTPDLVRGEASFITTTAAKKVSGELSNLIARIADSMSQQFGAFLVVEIWSAPDREVAVAADKNDIEPTELRPDFVISARGPNIPQQTLETLRKNLQRISIMKQPAMVRIDSATAAHPPDLAYVLKSRDAARLCCATISIRVRPIYRDHETAELYPAILRSLKRGMGRALKQTFFTFAKTRTNAKPEHFYSLGRRAMVKSVWDVDRRISEISDSFDFLLQVTPVNAEAAWREFRRSKFEFAPKFYYPPLAVEPEKLKRALYEVRIENIEDPTLGDLFRQRQDELDRKLTMLKDINTPRFLLGSRQVYGSVDDKLHSLAMDLLRRLPTRSRGSRDGTLTANEFADHARQEIEYYRSQLPSFTATAMVREDLFSGLICSGGNLLIGHQTKVPARRVQALLQHEIGTHLLTYYNGLAAPFQQLHSGFAGYDALQEGLAVLTEYLVGGLSTPRMRILAARVVAARMLVDGATFIDTFRTMDRDFAFSQRVAYTITMRTYRGGGLTKDAVYLQGLVEILEYLQRDGRLDPLFVGKIAAEHIPLIQELQHRKVLTPPPLRPRYLEMPGVAERLAQAHSGTTVMDLIK
ncbi:MAG: hypothetical protein ACI9G1_001919 [Pirellulaceae bacterium]